MNKKELRKRLEEIETSLSAEYSSWPWDEKLLDSLYSEKDEILEKLSEVTLKQVRNYRKKCEKYLTYYITAQKKFLEREFKNEKNPTLKGILKSESERNYLHTPEENYSRESREWEKRRNHELNKC